MTKTYFVRLMAVSLVVVSAYLLGMLSYKRMLFPAPAIEEAYYRVIGGSGELARFSEVSNRIQLPLDQCRGGSGEMVALILGQSNAANHAGRPSKAKTRVFNYYNGNCYRAEAPLLGASGVKGSVWPLLGDKLVATGTFSKVIFVNLAMGASSIARWSQGGDLYQHLEDVVKDMRIRGIEVTHILWQQGESDCRYRTTQEEYMKEFASMFEGVRAIGLSAPLYIAIASKNPKPCDSIQNAQRALVDIGRGIYPGPDTDSIAERFDGIHFSSGGLLQLADLWFEAISGSSH